MLSRSSYQPPAWSEAVPAWDFASRLVCVWKLNDALKPWAVPTQRETVSSRLGGE